MLLRKLLLIIFLLVPLSIQASVKLKDVVSVDGIRNNQLVGYGVVVGLNGTGDKDQTKVHLEALSEQLTLLDKDLNTIGMKVKNTAAVMITATLPPFASDGQLIDVTVSSIGDAKSLEGGTLVATVLKGVDGNVYAVAQGALLVGGTASSSGGNSVTKNHPTVGRIPNGATIEGGIDFDMNYSEITLFLNEFSLENTINTKNIVNKFVGSDVAMVVSPSSIKVMIPDIYRNSYFDFLNTILNLEIIPEGVAKVILDERTGTIVIGSEVKISTVAVSHGNLTVTVSNTVNVSQPPAFSSGETVVTNQKELSTAEQSANLIVLPATVTVSDLVKALNAMGVTPRDLISILRAISASGALHASLEVI